MKYKTAPDPDKPLTSAEFKRMKTVYGLDGLASIIGEENVAPLRLRSSAKQAKLKQRGTLQLSADVWQAIKSIGRGYNSRVEAVLREAIAKGVL